MALSKAEQAAAKQAKQKKILIALSVVLVAVLAIQVPKLTGGKKGSTAAAPAAAAPAAGAAPSPGAGAPAPVPAATPAPQAAKPGKAQLASFSLFEAKDPFVPQIKVPTAGTPSAGAAPAKGTAGGTGTTGGVGGSPLPAAPAYVTITVNGEAEALQAKDVFPRDAPMFRVVAVSKGGVKIGIAGGALARGKTVTLKPGRKLTLVDTATGARYTLQLVYVGSSPEQTASFTSGETTSAGTSPPPAGTTSATTP